VRVKTYDVAIVGGGVIGCSIAFELAAEKLRIAVYDRQQPGCEASWAAAGMLSPAPDSPQDLPLVPLCSESLNLYPKFVATIEGASGLSTGHSRQGTLEFFFGHRAEEERDRRVADCKRLGITAKSISVESARTREVAIGPAARSAAWLPDEAAVEPRLLMASVLAAARNRGVEFRANSPVTGLLIDRNRCIGLTAGGEHVSAAHVIVAAGCFSSQIEDQNSPLARYAPTRPVRGQMLALRKEGMQLKSVFRSERGYIVPRSDGRVIAGSTSEEAGFVKRVTPTGIREILDHAIELLPNLADAEIIETWSGLRPGTPDDLPILGPTEIEGLLIATGHYRNGILLAAVTAKLLREWVTTGHTTMNIEAFSPLRFTSGRLRARGAM
jgi:glycine oxidase